MEINKVTREEEETLIKDGKFAPFDIEADIRDQDISYDEIKRIQDYIRSKPENIGKPLEQINPLVIGVVAQIIHRRKMEEEIIVTDSLIDTFISTIGPEFMGGSKRRSKKRTKRIRKSSKRRSSKRRSKKRTRRSSRRRRRRNKT